MSTFRPLTHAALLKKNRQLIEEMQIMREEVDRWRAFAQEMQIRVGKIETEREDELNARKVINHET